MQTRNYGHIGAAGIYTRMALDHNLLAFATSGSQQELQSDMSVFTPAIGSPMSFSAPARVEDSLVVDFFLVYDFRISPHIHEIAEWIPGTISRCVGLGTVAQAWGVSWRELIMVRILNETTVLPQKHPF